MKELTFGFGIPIIIVLVITLIVQITVYFTDRPMWNEVEKHADEFVYDYTSSDKWLSTLILYDKDSTYVCEALLDHREKDCTIFGDHELLASSFNHFKSKKLYKTFVQKIPKEDFELIKEKKETVLEHLKRME
jgi:hypothetical protein